jgi:hypothetical protein
MHIHGTRMEKEIEIYAANLANKTKCMRTKGSSLCKATS